MDNRGMCDSRSKWKCCDLQLQPPHQLCNPCGRNFSSFMCMCLVNALQPDAVGTTWTNIHYTHEESSGSLETRVNAQAQPNFMLLAVPVHKITWAMGRACIRLTAQLMHMGPPFTTHLKSTQLSLQLHHITFKTCGLAGSYVTAKTFNQVVSVASVWPRNGTKLLKLH